jgi:hypothetical protein
VYRATNDGSRICQHWQRSANCTGHFRCEYNYSNLFIYLLNMYYLYLCISTSAKCMSVELKVYLFIWSHNFRFSMSLSLSPNSLYRQTTDCTEGGGLTREHCIWTHPSWHIWASCFFGVLLINKKKELCSGQSNEHSFQDWFQFVQRFQRGRLKCKSLRTMTHTDVKWWQYLTWPFADSGFDFKIICFYTFYTNLFPYDGKNGTWSSKNNGKDKEFKYNFLIICRYLNFVKNQRIIV